MRMLPGPAGAKVGIVGTGAMGRPVVDRLLAAGYQVAAYARRREARESLAASGAAVLTDVATLGSAATS